MEASSRPEEPERPTQLPYADPARSFISEGSREGMEEAGLEFDSDFDLGAIRAKMDPAPPGPSTASEKRLEESGYASVMARSSTSAYGTGWLLADQLSHAGSDSDDWDGLIDLGGETLRISHLSDLLVTKYAFVTGAVGAEGVGLVSFPDVGGGVSFADYRRLVTYLGTVGDGCDTGYVVVADRRGDKWSAVKTLLLQLSAYFPGLIRVCFVLKPEGVLQRALELGYKNVADDCAFKVFLCASVQDLHRYVDPKVLALEFGGRIRYNHLEWVQHRMDIERLRSSASAIAASLADFAAALKATELPNDAATTVHILNSHSAEKDAIQEEFRIAVRRGQQLLGRVRQAETKPRHTQLSPTRLGNVTAIERMLIQLEETETSFQTFWGQHHRRLCVCLDLRRFEEDFRRLQSSFAGRMLALEEGREVGESRERAEELLRRHREYSEGAEEEVAAARELAERGGEIMAGGEGELGGSLGPKCHELRRMAAALKAALGNRLAALQASRDLHLAVGEANVWCRRGVGILAGLAGSEASPQAALAQLDAFLAQTPRPLLCADPDAPPFPEASTLLVQVKERLADVRSLCEGQRQSLARSLPSIGSLSGGAEVRVAHPMDLSLLSAASTSTHGVSEDPVLGELLRTEEVYCEQITSVLHHYIRPMAAQRDSLPAFLQGVEAKIFGNLDELASFHTSAILPELSAASGPVEAASVLGKRMSELGTLYSAYCQSRPEADALLAGLPKGSEFLAECQRSAGHPLPLASYLLKPVQRISKYHLLIWELAKGLPEGGAERKAVEGVYEELRDLLRLVNAAVALPNIAGFPGDLRALGRPCLEADFHVLPGRRAKDKASLPKFRKTQSRRLFLFPSALLFAKRREPSAAEEYYEFKFSLASGEIRVLGMRGESRIELSEAGKQDLWALEPVEGSSASPTWLESLRQLEAGRLGSSGKLQRPHSWAAQSPPPSADLRNNNAAVLSAVSPVSSATLPSSIPLHSNPLPQLSSDNLTSGDDNLNLNDSPHSPTLQNISA